MGAGLVYFGIVEETRRWIWLIGDTGLKRFGNKIDGYFKRCEAEERFPDEAGLILYLKLSVADYERLRADGDGESGDYARLLEDARLRRESIISRELYSSGAKGTMGKLFLAKQAKNSGILGTAAEEGRLVIEVRISGSGAEFFD